jgi:uncharacterized protein
MNDPRAPFAHACLQRFEGLARRVPLPTVRALHLPPDPPPGHSRGEFCALELDDGSVGLCYVLLQDTLLRLRGLDPAIGLSGAPALEVARWLISRQGAERAIGLAALNALSRWFFDRAGWRPPASRDSLGTLDPQPGDHIGMIGLFTPLLSRVLASGAQLTVVELKPELVAEHAGWCVTLDAQALHACNKVLATGTLLLNDTLDEMLAHAAGASWLALVGPSVGCVPDDLFERGITLLGGSWVTDRASFLEALRAGQTRTHSVQKVSIQRQSYPGWSALVERL